ncbi:hypothetical protein DPMN_076976 [Dreissena polymorpha]|uniref:Uncharacterized protein n=1 Tax=Dreissena polymorpha TaxID=45954 RepID=A0A9D3YJM6_DREPO|nr:hypothetical protein DPMN_076976 [Dreissena polymorpha]
MGKHRYDSHFPPPKAQLDFVRAQHGFKHEFNVVHKCAQYWSNTDKQRWELQEIQAGVPPLEGQRDFYMGPM